jgi:hypothetical protein
MVAAIGHLTQEELVRWRMTHARLNAIEDKSEAYSPSDVEQAYLSKWKLGEEFCHRYGVDDAKDWAISCYTGLIFYKG